MPHWNPSLSCPSLAAPKPIVPRPETPHPCAVVLSPLCCRVVPPLSCAYVIVDVEAMNPHSHFRLYHATTSKVRTLNHVSWTSIWISYWHYRSLYQCINGLVVSGKPTHCPFFVLVIEHRIFWVNFLCCPLFQSHCINP